MSSQTQQIQTIELYIDYATIPSLAYFSHFLTHSTAINTTRIFALTRFKIPESVMNDYPPDTLYYHHVENHNLSAVLTQFAHILNTEEKQVQLHFHLNLFHSFEIMLNLFQIYKQHLNKISRIHLHLYDDGSEGIMSHYNFSHTADLANKIDKNKAALINLFTHSEGSFSDLALPRYLWSNIYTTQYYFLSDYFLGKPELAPLNAEIKTHKLIDLNFFHTLSDENKRQLKTILQISPEVENLLARIARKKIFLFTGTTAFDLNDSAQQRLDKIHHILVREHISPTGRFYIGDDYLLAFKGHPNSHKINEEIKAQYPDVICLPEHIPFEILRILGLAPHKMGGFASTSYFNYPKERISHIFFLSSLEEKTRALLDTYQKQFDLSKTMMAMQCIEQNNVFYCNLYA